MSKHKLSKMNTRITKQLRSSGDPTKRKTAAAAPSAALQLHRFDMFMKIGWHVWSQLKVPPSPLPPPPLQHVSDFLQPWNDAVFTCLQVKVWICSALVGHWKRRGLRSGFVTSQIVFQRTLVWCGNLKPPRRDGEDDSCPAVQLVIETNKY